MQFEYLPLLIKKKTSIKNNAYLTTVMKVPRFSLATWLWIFVIYINAYNVSFLIVYVYNYIFLLISDICLFLTSDNSFLPKLQCENIQRSTEKEKQTSLHILGHKLPDSIFNQPNFSYRGVR